MNNLIVNDTDGADGMKEIIDSFLSIIPGSQNSQAVPVLEANVLEESVFKNEWVSKNRACLIKGAVKHWPAVEKWRNKEYWLGACENFEINVYPHQNFVDGSRQEEGHQTMSYHDAIERLHENRDYVFSIPSAKIREGGRFGKIKNDIGGFEFLQSAEMPRFYDRMRFFTYRRAATNWHYHGVDETLMCQVNGAKRVLLLSPKIPRPGYVTKFLLKESYLDGQKLDASLDLKPLVTTVEEGDALYIPPYWHHAVIPEDGEIGFTVAFCWRSPIHKLGNFSDFFVRDVYKQGLKPFSLRALFLPLFGCYAGMSYGIKKLSGQM